MPLSGKGERNSKDAELRLEELREKIHLYDHHYYAESRPLVPDGEYDRLFNELLELEREFPELRRADSPSVRIGSDLSADFPEVEHNIPVLSLDKAYDEGQIRGWISKTIKNSGADLSFFVEDKIDGVSIVLYYEEGLLTRAVTRGNGRKGNDVTANVKTIRAVPLKIPFDADMAVRGEIFLPKSSFEEINRSLDLPFANPRNLAGGTLRRIKSAEVAAVPLSIYVYEAYYAGAPESHIEVLTALKAMGFPVNPAMGYFADKSSAPAALETFPDAIAGTFEDIAVYLKKREEEREDLPFEIDGLVFKVNELTIREQLGVTGHHPRWALAYKFEAPQGITECIAVEIQVGRTGRITPVARLKPVVVSGSRISNVTLHNQEYIDSLELAVGDRVAVSKRGDVIPAIEQVVDKNECGNSVWKIPVRCPTCGAELIKRGAHHFCPDYDCPDRRRGRVFFFAGIGQMDINNLGSETVDVFLRNGLISDIADLYNLDYKRIRELEGFGDKKVELIQAGIEKSKEQPYHVVLPSLGLPELGPKAAEILIGAGFNSIEKLFEAAERNDREALEAVHGIGGITAETIIRELNNPRLREQVKRLQQAGLQFSEAVQENTGEEDIFSGQIWCVTGSFEHFKPRSKAMEEVKRRGGKTTADVSGKTTHLLAGTAAGSKLEKARSLGAVIVSEEEFRKLITPG